MPRRPKNLRPDLNGVLVVDKPLGITSAAVCRRIRRVTGGAKVGHAGTLDPLATGVLVVCLGAATKLVPELMAGEKRYLAEIDLSAFSTTDDMEGEPTPVEVAPSSRPTRGDVERACEEFVGEIMQTPPAFSAIKLGGAAAYRLARAGETVVIAARPVRIHAIDVLDSAWPVVKIDVRCGKGTYIRSLARDLGVKLGTGGRLRSLRRTAVGPYTLEHAVSPDAITENPTLDPAGLATE